MNEDVYWSIYVVVSEVEEMAGARPVNWAVFEAVHGAVWEAVYEAVYRAVNQIVSDAVNGDQPVRAETLDLLRSMECDS